MESHPRLIKFDISGYVVQIPVTLDVIALVVSNAIPIFGVCFLGWDVYTILLLFWSENLIAGVFNVLAMAACSREKVCSSWDLERASAACQRTNGCGSSRTAIKASMTRVS